MKVSDILEIHGVRVASDKIQDALLSSKLKNVFILWTIYLDGLRTIVLCLWFCAHSAPIIHLLTEQLKYQARFGKRKFVNWQFSKTECNSWVINFRVQFHGEKNVLLRLISLAALRAFHQIYVRFCVSEIFFILEVKSNLGCFTK